MTSTPLLIRLRLRIDQLLDIRHNQQDEIHRLTNRVQTLTAERDLLRRELRAERRRHESTQITNRIRETENTKLRRALGRKPRAELAA